MNISLELSYPHSKGESPFSRETLAPESFIFILEIIKTSKDYFPGSSVRCHG